MHRPAQNYVGDSESLQADVMRFMAIIAFCLIAILALVKHAEPAAETTADSAPPEPAAEPPEPEPVTQMARLVAPPVDLPQQPPARPEPASELPPPTTEPTTQPPEPQPTAEPEPVAEVQPAPPPAARPTPEPEAPPAAPASPAEDPEEEGLILRFASDGDFLRLIARGDIRVYAFQDTDVLTLSESYRFLDTSSPGQVYELLPPSIPSLVVDALRQARTDIDGYRWGIALPGHISNQIEQHLGRVTSGQLVIDRYGDVRHVAAS